MKNVFVIALLLLLSSASTLAAVCACCAERGHHAITRAVPDKQHLDMLGEINFAPSAELYMDAAGFDGIKGISGIETAFSDNGETNFNIAETFSRKTWRLNITTPKGGKATLTLPMPRLMTRYSVDTRFDNASDSANIVLYKEFSFDGTIGAATGIFSSASSRATKYSLVFQGQGNACDNASDFKYWRLNLRGPRTDFAIFGGLK